MRAIRRQIAVTAPIAGITRALPFLIDFGQSLYFHYESGGILTGMSNHNEQPGFDTSVDEAWRETHVAAAIGRLRCSLMRRSRVSGQGCTRSRLTTSRSLADCLSSIICTPARGSAAMG